MAENMLRDGRIGRIVTISARTREHWQGIFNAHPWLSGPSASYLGFSARGGGATGEHSHAINIWQHFAHLAGAGRVVEVSATLDRVARDGVDYDRSAFITLTTENGLVGDVIQDVVTSPAEKSARLQGETGFVEWRVNAAPGKDIGGLGRAGCERPRKSDREDQGRRFHSRNRPFGGGDGRENQVVADLSGAWIGYDAGDSCDIQIA